MKIKAKELYVEPSEPVEMDKPIDVFSSEEELPTENTLVTPEESKKKATTMKIIVWVCLLNGFLWVWCSYILAWRGQEQIAESLSQVALTEIIGVVLVYALKSLVENLSKNNSWPDKHNSNQPGGVG